MEGPSSLSSISPRLIFRVVGTGLISRLPGKGGVLSTIINRAKGGSSTENKNIVVFQSNPFKSTERSHIGEPLYRSEDLDGADEDISPSRVAVINCPIGQDCEIRIDVIYSGASTSGKEITICSKSVFLQDLIRKLRDIPVPGVHHPNHEIRSAVPVRGGSYVTEMESEYCSGARLYIELADGFKPILCHPSFLPIARKSPKNPLEQQYVFYSEEDYSSPMVYAEEYALEPRIATKLPIVFLENTISMLMRSTGAWRARRDLEAMRQGCFSSRREALRSGWHEVTVSVLGAKLPDVARVKNSGKTVSSGGQGSAGYSSGYSSGYLSYVPANIDSDHIVCSADTETDFDDDDEQQQQQGDPSYPESSADCNSEGEVGVTNADVRIDSTCTAIMTGGGGGGGGGGGFSTTRSKGKIAKAIQLAGKSLVLGAKAAASASASAAISVASSVRRSNRVDESKPSTFVEVSIEDSTRVFANVIGRTNSEYFTANPAYGSNLNLGHGTAISKKPQGEHTSAGLATVLTQPKDYRFRIVNNNNAFEYSGNTSATGVAASGTMISGGGATTGDLIDFSSLDSSPEKTKSSAASSEFSATLSAAEEELYVPGYVAAFVRYVPRRKNTMLKFNLYCVEDVAAEGNKKSPPKLLGWCSVPLGESDIFDGWLPLQVDPLDPFTTPFTALHSSKEVQVRVRVQIISPDPLPPASTDIDTGISSGLTPPTATTTTPPYIAPASFPTGIRPIRNPDGSSEYSLQDRLRLRAVSSPRAAALTIDHEEVWSACYDWLWPLGFRGLDPLVIETSPSNTGTGTTIKAGTAAIGKSGKGSVFSSPASATSSRTDAHTPASSAAFSPSLARGGGDGSSSSGSSKVVDLLSLEDDEQTTITAAGATSPSYQPPEDSFGVSLSPLAHPATAASSTSPSSSSSSGGYESFARADCPYPLAWMDRHISSLEELGEQLRGLLSELRGMFTEGSTFRSSCMKKLMPMQMVPINLHMQVMAVRRHCRYAQDRSYPEGVIDAISCGSMAPHGLGYKKGGLDAQENAIAAAKLRLDKLKAEYSNAIELSASECISAADSAACGLREQLCREALEFESSIVSVGHRRLFAVSQAVSIAASALMMKLTLVAEGMIPAAAALGWLKHGFLLVFEGLLSVILNERAMIEDTVSAVEGLRLYQFRILPAPDDAVSHVDVTIKGREVQLLFPAAALEALPAEYSQQAYAGGAVITIFPVLFTQGIDMQQSLALAATATASAASAAASAAAARVGAGFASIAGSSSKSDIITSSLSNTDTSPTGVGVAGTGSSPSDFSGGGGGGGSTDTTSVPTEVASGSTDYQRSINTKALVLLHEYCLRLKPLPGFEVDIASSTLLEKLTLVQSSSSSNRKGAPPQALAQAGSGSSSSGGSIFGVPGTSPPQADAQLGVGRPPIVSATSTPSSSSSSSRTFVTLSSIASSAASMASSKYKAFTSGTGSGSSSSSGGVGVIGGRGPSPIPPSSDGDTGGGSGRTSPVPAADPGTAGGKVSLIHPLLRDLADTIVGNNAAWKNVEMLVAVERAVVMLDGCRATFCKSGKDRTGMAVTYEQSRQLGERFGCGTSQQRILRDASTMRIHGTRILVAEKNIGRRVYSINKLQVQFLPLVYRPPNSVLEDLLRKDDAS